ncbi:hypothetical protein HC251_24065 [Iamia sp. SCSIO 61187]|uniref:hypothetical protein n=1 Tax=Iamia sp. SCSIO 61187 TaxID=2722752 RepID=UPI001C6387AF|nr:hypothetical protein [Iamia sp. SCSIO 61187]QYG95199.1 hypothetical protein HC251_24065 [Iamia sp. SCSIO 61187]
MVPDDRDLGVAPRTKFSSAHAAELALTTSGPRRTPSRDRILRAATVQWCRDLQFPTARDVAQATGLSSVSSVVTPFGRCVDLQAEIIRTEWGLVSRGWAAAPDGSRPRWLVEHARRLAELDGACLRLPSLVCSAVAAAGVTALPRPDLLVPLHAMAALARPDAGDDPRALVIETVALAGWPDRRQMAVPA